MGILATVRSKRRLIRFSLVRRKPLFFVNALWQLLKQEFSGRRQLKGVMLALHYKCNLKCEHCYEKRLRKPSAQLLTTDEKIDVIKQCRELGILSFDFIGGESHLSPDFEMLVREAGPSSHYITLCTNGLGFDREKVSRFRKMGIDKFNISLDSWDPEEHDRFRRREGAHSEALNTIQLCRELGVDVTISVVIQKGTTRHQGFGTLVDFVTERKIALACKLAVPVGNWEGELDLLADEEDKAEIDRLHLQNPLITRDVHSSGGACPALLEFCSITAYGDVMPCNAIQVSVGNVKERSLKKILSGGEASRFCSKGYMGCPPAEDTEFISEYLRRSAKATSYPIDSTNFYSDSDDS